MEEAIRSLDLARLKTQFLAEKEKGTSIEILKTTNDTAIRNHALSATQQATPTDDVRRLLAFAIQAAKEELCARQTPVHLMQDVFDVSSIARCEQLFVIVSDNIPIWKSPVFFEAVRNQLLRLCNDLLKRVSTTIDTAFCGRILVFLARCLPLNEKSGLNLASQFNADNVTRFETQDEGTSADVGKPVADDVDMEEGEMKDSSLPVDYALYCKFWSLQSVFSVPNSCYEKANWKKLQHNMNEVLSALISYKLEDDAQSDTQSLTNGDNSNDRDDPAAKRRKRVATGHGESSINSTLNSTLNSTNDENDVTMEQDHYFAKYLTSQKLLQLQLNDSQFRRYFLVQCLILFQYLVSDVKFKERRLTLNDEQLRFVIESTEKCYRLLRETHPRGVHFAESIKRVLNREKSWSEWKNGGCADFTLLCDKERMQMFKRRPIARYDPKKIDLGNVELTKLWNIEPDMLAACRSAARRFTPSLEDFIRDPLDELDPDQQVEDQYKLINQETFQWRASRFLMTESPFYFQPTKADIVTMGPHLAAVIADSAKTIPSLKAGMDAQAERLARRKAENALAVGRGGGTTAAASNGVENGDEMTPPSVQTARSSASSVSSSPGRGADPAPAKVTESHLRKLAPLLAKGWEQLATALNIEEESIRTMRMNSQPTAIVETLLQDWMESEGDGATVKKMSNVLLQAELFGEKVSEILKSDTLKKHGGRT